MLFIFSVIVSLFTYDDYGIAWDENAQKGLGSVTYDYLIHDNTAYLDYRDRDYGVAFEFPLVFIERAILGLEDTRDVFLMRHFVTHLFFLVSAFFLFQLIVKMTAKKHLAVIGFLMLVLNPRIYAHSFFNSKDLPFLSMFIICYYFFYIAFEKKSIQRFFIVGILGGILTNLRIIGIMFPFLVFLFLLIDALQKKDLEKQLSFGVAVLLGFAVAIYTTWPYLWSDPISNFKEAFLAMSKFRWDQNVLFNGEVLTASQLPKSYIFKWIGISTPLGYLTLIVLGLFFVIKQILTQTTSFLFNEGNRIFTLLLACIAAPLTAILFLDSIVYDGWRQLYFIYPPLVLIAVFGINKLWEHFKYGKEVTFSILVLSFGLTLVSMVKNAPYQQVYFNEAFWFKEEGYIKANYEQDYWGTSYKEAIEQVLNSDPSDTVSLSVNNFCGQLNFMILDKRLRERILLQDSSEATYFITAFRWNHEGYPQYADKEYASIKRNNSTISKTFKLR